MYGDEHSGAVLFDSDRRIQKLPQQFNRRGGVASEAGGAKAARSSLLPSDDRERQQQLIRQIRAYRRIAGKVFTHFLHRFERHLLRGRAQAAERGEHLANVRRLQLFEKEREHSGPHVRRA